LHMLRWVCPASLLLEIYNSWATRAQVLRIRYWRKFDLELADRRSCCQPRKKCPNRWRSHLLPRTRQFSKRASSGHQWLFILFD
jgi:hypothetical protein